MRLDLPLQIHAENRTTEPRRDALCMLLARFTYPKRYSDLHLEFGWTPERVSRITSVLCRLIVDRWQHLLTFDHHRLTPRKLREYANIIRKKASPLHNCWGFVDGTVRPIARPVRMQRTVYNGHKRVHALKYHAIVTPDGIIAHFYGPVEGRRHDKVIWNESGIMDHLLRHSHEEDGTPMQIYGDPAYGVNRHLISPFQGARLDPRQQLFNKRMSRVRIVVEWVFKEVIQQFQYFSLKTGQRVLLSNIGLQFKVAVLLHNAHVCLHNPQIPQYFQLANGQIVRPFDDGALFHPPTLREYFHN
jgi:hypothetical protein